MPDEFEHPELKKLSKSARARVEAALKATLDREIASSAVAGGADPVAAHSRSQGAFFSRSKTTDQMMGDDRTMVDKVTTMDDAAFDKFAERLATLKSIKTR
jgi:hypothetical protein